MDQNIKLFYVPEVNPRYKIRFNSISQKFEVFYINAPMFDEYVLFSSHLNTDAYYWALNQVGGES